MTDVVTRLPNRLDHKVLRLAREIRAEVAEALASRGATMSDDERLDPGTGRAQCHS